MPLVWIFYFMITSLCTFLLLGLFIAVVTGTFTRVRQMHGTAFLSHEEEEVQETAEQKPGLYRTVTNSFKALSSTTNNM